MTVISGEAARTLLAEQLTAHSNGILAALAPYEAGETIRVWHATIRRIEEFINVVLFGVDDAFSQMPLAPLLTDEAKDVIAFLHSELTPRFGQELTGRFVMTTMQVAAIDVAFRVNGLANYGAGLHLDTIGGAVDYLQSRRRHFVSLLYTMPGACTGTETFVELDALNVMLPIVDLNCATVTGLYQKQVLADIFPTFSLDVDAKGFRASQEFEALDSSFLEPERASIMVMAELRNNEFVQPKLEPIDRRKIFSAAELRNNIRLMTATYAPYGLGESGFGVASRLVIFLSRHCEDDYFVTISKTKLISALACQTDLDPQWLAGLLINTSSDYATNTNGYQPFVAVGEMLVSNVNLLSRFLYAFKNDHLDGQRRFQIHAGFVLEAMVKRDLVAMGFSVTDIKRIERKEFDVVAVRDDVIYNFQCKNNWLDLNLIETDRPRFVRFNRILTRYYKRALAKEKKREDLLLKTLGLSRIEHYVVSRFPVITDDPRIIPHNGLARFARG